MSPLARVSAVNADANAQLIAGNYRAGVALEREALAYYLEHGKDDPALAALHNDLAIALHFDGRLRQAVAEHEAALEVRTRVLGPRHPDTARSLDNLAQVYCDLRDFDKSQELASRSLAIREETLQGRALGRGGRRRRRGLERAGAGPGGKRRDGVALPADPRIGG